MWIVQLLYNGRVLSIRFIEMVPWKGALCCNVMDKIIFPTMVAQTHTENREFAWCELWWHRGLSWRQSLVPSGTGKLTSWASFQYKFSEQWGTVPGTAYYNWWPDWIQCGWDSTQCVKHDLLRILTCYVGILDHVNIVILIFSKPLTGGDRVISV